MTKSVRAVGVALGLSILACGEEKADTVTADDTVTAKLRRCNLLSDGELKLDEPEYAEDKCEERCLVDEATCEDLALLFCGGAGNAIGSVNLGVRQCLTECEALEDGDEVLGCDDGSYDELQRFELCDGWVDCDDGEDELNCPAGTHFVCGDGSKVPAEFECDGGADCDDASDEDGCSSSDTFTCGDGLRISKLYVCDGGPDCEDGSDEEQGCAKLTCGG